MRTVVLLLLGLMVGVGCTKANPNQCCTDEADCNAHGIPAGTTCDQGLVCRGNQCIAEVCSTAAQCDLSSPFCVEGSCTEACTADSECPGNGGSPANLYCVGGACVGCRADMNDCPASAPVCDMGSCRGCTSGTECSSSVCDADMGTCVDETAVVYASPSGGGSAACSKTDPCSLDHAFSVIDASRPNIKLATGTYTSPEAYLGTYTLSIYGPGTVGSLTITSNGGGLRVRNIESTLGIICEPSASNATPPTLDVKDSTFTIDVTNGPAVDTAQCRASLTALTVTATSPGNAFVFEGYGGAGSSIVTVDRLHLNGGDPGIFLTNQSTMTITNSVFEDQGTTSGAIALAVGGAGGESGSIAFSTFHNSQLKCPTGNTILTSTNNIFLNEAAGAPGNTVTGSSCSHTYDLIKPQTASVGATNLLGMDPRFVNAAAGDFHLRTGSPAIDAADPAATLSTDYDGTARPQGTGRDIGAFEYKP